MWEELLPRPSLLVLDDLHKSFGEKGEEREGGKREERESREEREEEESRLVAGLRQTSSDSATCRCVQSRTCEESLQKPRSWHTVILRPEPFVAYRTFGLAVALLGVLSRVRWPLAQMWDAQHDVDFFLWLQRQSIQEGGLSASDAAHISKKKKKRTRRQPPCFWLSATFHENVGQEKGSAHSGTVTPCSNRDQRWLESMPFNIFISIDGEAKSLDTTSSRKERQSRRKRFYDLSILWATVYSFC